jgi:hypothetical protein
MGKAEDSYRRLGGQPAPTKRAPSKRRAAEAPEYAK